MSVLFSLNWKFCTLSSMRILLSWLISKNPKIIFTYFWSIVREAIFPSTLGRERSYLNLKLLKSSLRLSEVSQLCTNLRLCTGILNPRIFYLKMGKLRSLILGWLANFLKIRCLRPLSELL
jgi:hypothetical protein